MVDHELCNESIKGIHIRVLHIPRWKNKGWLHYALQTYNMYGNPNQSMDDKFFLQIFFVFSQEVGPR